MDEDWYSSDEEEIYYIDNHPSNVPKRGFLYYLTCQFLFGPKEYKPLEAAARSPTAIKKRNSPIYDDQMFNK